MQTKTTSWALVNLIEKIDAKDFFITLIFITLSVFIPAFLAHTPNNQWLTGTLINMLLVLSVHRLGLVSASFVAIIPSSIALIRGLLPAPLAMFIPLIILSNLLMVYLINKFKKHPLRGVLTASLAKYFLLASFSLLPLKIPLIFIKMLQWPQLITALIGGFLAIRLLSFKKQTLFDFFKKSKKTAHP